jgi:hypothetical protein
MVLKTVLRMACKTDPKMAPTTLRHHMLVTWKQSSMSELRLDLLPRIVLKIFLRMGYRTAAVLRDHLLMFEILESKLRSGLRLEPLPRMVLRMSLKTVLRTDLRADQAENLLDHHRTRGMVLRLFRFVYGMVRIGLEVEGLGEGKWSSLGLDRGDVNWGKRS